MKDEKSKELKEKKKFESPEEFKNEIKGQISKLCKKSNWTSEDLLSLKEYLYPINNHITYLMGRVFLKNYFGIEKETAYFQYSKMNDNGYDIAAKINESLIIAEIKGNIPCGKNKKYGANQKKSINNDLENLCKLKDKGKKQIEKLGKFEDAYKFLVLLKNNNVAINSLIKKLSDRNFVILEDDKINLENLEKENIYIVLIDL